MVRRRWPAAAVAPRKAQGGSDADREGDVSEVADEQFAVGQEVRHATASERRLAEESVDQVSQRPAPDEAKGDSPALRPRAGGQPSQDNHRDHTHDGEDPGRP
jgi:hypothetical protein